MIVEATLTAKHRGLPIGLRRTRTPLTLDVRRVWPAVQIDN